MEKTKNPREAAFLAVTESIKQDLYLSSILDSWKERADPPQRDFDFAKEIALGTVRMALALDNLAEQLTSNRKLSLKLREKVLLRTAVYQYYFLDRVPLYAIVDETMKIAKKYFNENVAKFMNAVLRKLDETEPELPAGDTVPEMSIRYSYPPFYVQQLIDQYGVAKARELMEAGNRPGPVMFRIRPQFKGSGEHIEGTELLGGISCPIGVVKESTAIPQIASSPDFYIQNMTPAVLIDLLAKDSPKFHAILDLCAFPGGKLIAAHDLFPDAVLFANDVSPERLKPLLENLEKYAISCTVSCCEGQSYKSETLFDLVILDVPCSNSGVLNKRPEARWRISQKQLEQLQELQLELIRHAKTLIVPGGEIWYMTCSILKQENRTLAEKAADLYGLEIREMEAMFPAPDGRDGGFACAFTLTDR